MSETKTAANNLNHKLLKFLAGKWFLVAIVLVFIFQASWIAVSGVYPMAFDEDTHLGIIRFFAAHPNPFFANQPNSLNIFGAVVHDPSYLYRYLMSWPWRVIVHLTGNFSVQIVAMRFINIALFTIGLLVFRQLLLKATTNRLMVNFTLLLVTLTPITSQLAAQINYDNLLIPLMAACLLFTIKVSEDVRRGKLNLWHIGWLFSLLMLTALVKYTFLTVMVPIFIFLTWQLFNLKRKQQSKISGQFKLEVKRLGALKVVLLGVAVVVSFGLFFERYGMNIIRYRTPTPSCVKVLGVQRCQSYSIYQRGVYYAQNKPGAYTKNPVVFTYNWLKHMLYNLMMALNGPTSGYSIGSPLVLPYSATLTFSVIGILLALIYWRRLFKTTALKLFVWVMAFYGTALWLTNYVDYLHTGRRVAIQGRYLVPFLPFLFLIFLLACDQLLKTWPKIRGILATGLVICLIAGGGVATFILHSDSSWYWPNAKIVQMNNDARVIVRHFVPGWGADYSPYWQSSFQF